MPRGWVASCDWIRQAHNLCLTGPTGCGKTWLACALGNQACRHGRRSTLIASQLPTEHWQDYLGEATLADAILDRLMHGSHRLELRGESMRKLHAELTDRDRLASKDHSSGIPVSASVTIRGIGGHLQWNTHFFGPVIVT